VILSFRLQELQCENICRKINDLLQKEKPDPDKYYLVVRLNEVINSSENLLPKITQAELPSDQEQH